jgi:hypothetical protein
MTRFTLVVALLVTGCATGPTPPALRPMPSFSPLYGMSWAFDQYALNSTERFTYLSKTQEICESRRAQRIREKDVTPPVPMGPRDAGAPAWRTLQWETARMCRPVSIEPGTTFAVFELPQSPGQGAGAATWKLCSDLEAHYRNNGAETTMCGVVSVREAQSAPTR